MKLLCALILLALTCVLSTESDAQNLTFNGVKYHLTSVEMEKHGDILNQYMRKGDTDGHWRTMIGVNHWRHLDEFGALHRWKRSLEKLTVGDVDMLLPDGEKPGPANGVFQAFILAPDHSYCIGYLCRFKKKPEMSGVMVYEFAMFIPMHKGEPQAEPFFKERGKLAFALLKLDAGVYRQIAAK